MSASFEMLLSGIIHVNDQIIADEPWVPFGSRRASGNSGRHGSTGPKCKV